RGYGVVRSMVGHGIGREMHEDPAVPNYGKAGHGPKLEVGMVLAIEPMVNMGTWQTLEDGWKCVTLDGKPSAHYENTVALTENGAEILTL
ncbi:MAG TPA: type I methionyl aminopeptidase, partial [Clostridiales bacterium]|nr:type I methionyl aminopeptidase [Clostridiales bacterium]